MSIKIYEELEQGSDEWFDARCGLLTASEMKLIISPKNLKPANNDKTRAHVYELLGQQITNYVEPSYIGDNMLRGWEDEVSAKEVYSEHYADVHDVGFIVNNKWGFPIGYSPDGLVGDDGLIECKSRIQKLQVQTITDDAVPDEFIIQIQTGLLVSGRKWCDFISYSAGLPMYTKRVYPDRAMQAAILWAARAFYKKINTLRAKYDELLLSKEARLIPTERKVEEEISV